MWRPSAYCATSSGIAITNRRVRTQPHCPAAFRTRFHSSNGTAFSSGVAGGSEGSSSERSVRESSSQLAGGGGGFGIGGGGYFGCLAAVFFGGSFGFFGGGGGSRGFRGMSTRGVMTCTSTSTF